MSPSNKIHCITPSIFVLSKTYNRHATPIATQIVNLLLKLQTCCDTITLRIVSIMTDRVCQFHTPQVVLVLGYMVDTYTTQLHALFPLVSSTITTSYLLFSTLSSDTILAVMNLSRATNWRLSLSAYSWRRLSNCICRTRPLVYSSLRSMLTQPNCRGLFFSCSDNKYS